MSEPRRRPDDPDRYEAREFSGRLWAVWDNYRMRWRGPAGRPMRSADRAAVELHAERLNGGADR